MSAIQNKIIIVFSSFLSKPHATSGIRKRKTTTKTIDSALSLKTNISTSSRAWLTLKTMSLIPLSKDQSIQVNCAC
ncbi:hypothetical protein RRG08_058613 [Elysia crispata]|uniref:Uncharacterized protein n=1 Tax=Elysia crispata TaxID=231223 RepID=A0AAE0Z122_9GAST|nr:hypothetical protein RRG08_058613 [Elysia crispata]